jgi:hypothetical protein
MSYHSRMAPNVTSNVSTRTILPYLPYNLYVMTLGPLAELYVSWLRVCDNLTILDALVKELLSGTVTYPVWPTLPRPVACELYNEGTVLAAPFSASPDPHAPTEYVNPKSLVVLALLALADELWRYG